MIKKTFFFGALACLLTAPAVFLVVALAEGLGLGEALGAAVEQYGERRQNLLVCGAVGIFPLIIQAGLLWVIRKVSRRELTLELVLGGVLPVLAVLAFSNYEFWRVFLPGRTYPGFPHGLEFVVGPFIFAPFAMVLGLFLGWLVARSRER